MNIRNSVLALVLLLPACATVKTNHIEPAARAHIDTVDTYIAVPQEEIYADIVRSNTTAAAGGGLLFAIIDSAVDNSRTKSAEQLIQPIRNNLLDFDYAQALKNEIKNNLTQLNWMTPANTTLERSVTDSRYRDGVSSSAASAVMFVSVDYRLSAEFNAIENMVSVIMFPNVDALNEYKQGKDSDPSRIDDDTDNIFRDSYTVTTSLPVYGSKENNAAKLSFENSTAVKDALTKSAEMISLKIVEGLESQAKN